VGDNSTNFKSWQVSVFDNDGSAGAMDAFLRRRCKLPACNATTMRAANVVYFGNRFKAAIRAMAALRRS